MAREVLADCACMLEDLVEAPPLKWRARWVGMAALLRAVGHVLDKVDSQQSPAMSVAIKAAWADLHRTKPAPVIFHGFIDSERDSVVKEYRHGVQRTVHVHMIARTDNKQVPQPPIRDERVMRDGPFKDRDPRDVVREALVWWRTYLDDIDQRSTCSP